MGKFGWDLPPGCTLRDIEDAAGGNAVELTPYLGSDIAPAGVLFFYVEDGTLAAQVPNPDSYPREYTLGECDWNDELSDVENYRAAALKALELWKAKL